MQDALKAAVILSVAHMLVTGISPKNAYTKVGSKVSPVLNMESEVGPALEGPRNDVSPKVVPSLEGSSFDVSPEKESKVPWIGLSFVVTLAVFICNAVAASQDKDEDHAKHGLESVACVIAFCVLVGLLYMKYLDSTTWLTWLPRKNLIMLGVFLYTFFTAIAVIV